MLWFVKKDVIAVIWELLILLISLDHPHVGTVSNGLTSTEDHYKNSSLTTETATVSVPVENVPLKEKHFGVNDNMKYQVIKLFWKRVMLQLSSYLIQQMIIK